MPLPGHFRRSKLDCVTDKVGNDLSETKRVADQLIRDIGLDIVCQVEVVLRGPNDESLQDAEDSLTKRVGDGFHRHTTGFDCSKQLVCNLGSGTTTRTLRNVQDIVDDQQ